MQSADDIYGGEYIAPEPEEKVWPSGMHNAAEQF